MQYGDALAPLRDYMRRGPDGVLGHVWLGAVLVRLGASAPARATIAEVMSRLPHLTLSRWRLFELYRDSEVSRPMRRDLHAADMP